jgi:flagellar secretion chaperone FliS
MNIRPGDAYLETQVHTASPVKLRLLLIEGAMRFLTQAGEQAAKGDLESASEATTRARDILAEILNNVWNAEGYVARQQKSIYGYLLRLTTIMQLRGQFDHVQSILKVLGEERETWRQLAEKHPNLIMEKKESMISAPHISAFSPPSSLRRELSLEA